ncbi:MAG: glycine cleavage system protein GcvH [Micromonosporaceae bacterium]|nr:glycine cleavage system protein GcvH [Micromonosporaceae bacterium]
MIPEHLSYTTEHEWVVRASTGAAYRVGVTHFAQQALGDVVFVQLPDVGAAVTTGEPLGEVESTKSVSEVYSPLSGVVTAVNNALIESPELVNSDPYGGGWLAEIEPAEGALPDGLLDAAGYRELIQRT